MAVILCLTLAACSAPSRDAAGITAAEREAIVQKLKGWGETGPIGKITRVSVDSFVVEVGKAPYSVSLREDGILTEGNLTKAEIESIKQTALARRRMKQFNISSIRQRGPDLVEVMTGDFGTGTGEIITFRRVDNTWTVRSVSRWVE